MSDSSPTMVKAAAIGGVAFGIAGGLPLISALNCLCCSLIIGSGVLAAFVYSRDCTKVGAGFRPGQGALLGVLTGIFYAITTTLIALPFRMLMDPSAGIEQAVEQLQGNPDIPPFVIEVVRSMGGGTGFLIGAVVGMVLGVIFGAVGGAIGGAIFKVEEPPSQSPQSYDAPPPPPPVG